LILIIQNLQIENESLRQEISVLQKILSIPVDENHRYTHFRYQIYSLEKQIALLTRLLDAKREAVATCETILLELNQFLQ
jgi:dynactin complex subunit